MEISKKNLQAIKLHTYACKEEHERNAYLILATVIYFNAGKWDQR